MPLRGRWITGGIIALCALAALVTYHLTKQMIQKDARDQAVAGVITGTFSAARALKVGELTGDVQAKSDDARLGGMLYSGATMRAPYSIDYYLDLSKVDLSSVRWRPDTETLVVTVPAVTIGKPRIAVEGMTIEQQGPFVTRDASAALVKGAVGKANGYAIDRASKPDMIAKARDNARRAVAELLQVPLNAIGRERVRVEVRYANEGAPLREDMDRSTPISEVLANN